MDTLVGKHETVVRPIYERADRKVVCVLGINRDKWIVRVEVPDGKGGRRQGHHVHESEMAAIADYEMLIEKLISATK